MNTARHTATRRLQRGVTLVESCIVMAITAITLALAAPSFEQTRQRQHLEGVAAQLENDIMFTRSLAVARNQTLRFAFAGDRCYVVHTGTGGNTCTCDNSGNATCTGSPEVLRVVKLSTAVPVTLQSNRPWMSFDAVKGTVTPTATVQVQAESGAVIRNVVNVMGRVRNCSPAPGLSGHVTCPPT